MFGIGFPVCGKTRKTHKTLTEKEYMLKNIDIVLVRPQQSGNVGGVARTISNHGFQDFILVDPPHLDIEQVRWMAPHAKDIVNKAYYTSTVQQAVEHTHIVYGTTARKRGWDIPHLELADFLKQVHQQIQKNPQIKIALLFGPEDSGLSNTDLSFCQYTVELPTAKNASLNLSQAVNVFGSHLLHYFRQHNSIEESQKQNSPKNSRKPISQKIYHSITERSLMILDASDYLQAKNRLQIRHQLLRFLSQAQGSEHDVSILSGMINKVYHKLRISGILRPPKKDQVPNNKSS